MYKGRHVKRSKAASKPIKPLTLLVSLVLVLAISMAGTLALLLDITGSKTNTFTPSTVVVEVNDDGTIVNESDIPVYIRAAVAVTWQNDSGEIYSVAPVLNQEYTLSHKDWVKGTDGYYYWPDPVEPNDSTGEEITATRKDGVSAPEGFKNFTVEIAAQAIQADGVVVKEGKEVPAVVDAWGVTLDTAGITITAKN